MFTYNVVQERLTRQIQNYEAVRTALLSGDVNLLLPNITFQKLDRICERYSLTRDELLGKCKDNPDVVLGLDLYLAKESCKQSSLDEANVFKGLDDHLSEWDVKDLPNAGRQSVKLQSPLNTKVVSKSIDAFVFNDSLIGLIAYKIVIGEGGSQTSSFKELQHYAETFQKLNRDQIISSISHRIDVTDEHKFVMILLIDTDRETKLAELRRFEDENVWVVSHTELQEKLIEYSKDNKRTILHST